MANNTINTNNPRRTPIPVVPITMKIVNLDGTPTRQGQLLLEQLQQVTGGSGSGIVSEIPAGALNGTNAIFTLSASPDPGSLELFLNGVLQNPGMDYTLSGGTITYTVPPKSNDWQRAYY